MQMSKWSVLLKSFVFIKGFRRDLSSISAVSQTVLRLRFTVILLKQFVPLSNPSLLLVLP